MTAPSAQLSRFNRPFDLNMQLQDDTTQITATGAGTVGGSAVIRDLGDGWTGIALAIIDINTLDTTTGDEMYLLKIEGSNSASFASGIVALGIAQVGGATANTVVLQESVATSLALSKRLILPFHNEKLGTIYRYARARFALSGTTPILDCEVYLTKLP